VTGEEGRLYRVNLHGKEYFVKKWHGSHRRMTYANPDTNFSHHSPYEHKMLYYEYKIINTLFPDQTPVLATAYDPRIKKNPQTGAHEFDGKFGKPVTVIEAIPVELAVAKDIEHIKREAYGRARQVIRLEEDNDVNTGGDSPLHPVALADDTIHQLLGTKTFRHSDYGASLPLGEHPLISQFTNYGIVPIHPSLNIIPTKMTNGVISDGVFLELTIKDSALLNAKNYTGERSRIF